MKKYRAALTFWAGAVFLLSVTSTYAQAPVEDRAPPVVAENKPDTSLQLLLELQSLREELTYLRGTVEELEYKLGRLQGQQQENYADLDGRIRDLYSGVVASPTLNPTVPTLALKEAATSTAAAGAPVAESLASNLYQEGFGALRVGERDKAIQAFESLIEIYPSAPEVADALYWLGETYWLANKREESRQSFVQLLDHNPTYRKASDAKYRLGIIYQQLSDLGTAQEYMQQVVDAGSGQALAAQAWIAEHQIDPEPSLNNPIPDPNLQQ